jgi:hypothetical protein
MFFYCTADETQTVLQSGERSVSRDRLCGWKENPFSCLVSKSFAPLYPVNTLRAMAASSCRYVISYWLHETRDILEKSAACQSVKTLYDINGAQTFITIWKRPSHWRHPEREKNQFISPRPISLRSILISFCHIRQCLSGYAFHLSCATTICTHFPHPYACQVPSLSNLSSSHHPYSKWWIIFWRENAANCSNGYWGQKCKKANKISWIFELRLCFNNKHNLHCYLSYWHPRILNIAPVN